jgi:CRISPR/Cas system-associated protein endoribonuclease Cas2
MEYAFFTFFVMRNFIVFDIGRTTVKYAVINEGCFRIYMLNLSFYSDDWSGYTRLLRDKQDRETPHRGGSLSAHCSGNQFKRKN